MTGWSDVRPNGRKDRVVARGESVDSLHGVPADLDEWSRFYSRRASEEVCPKHRNNRLESAGWHREMTKRCLFLVAAAKRGGGGGPESDNDSGPSASRGMSSREQSRASDFGSGDGSSQHDTHEPWEDP